jgi:raffinose/stachyose/melibiose transport system substrate-binding protein
MVRTFNEKYAGTYRIEVEEVPGDTNYRDKMLTLLAAGDVPLMVYGSTIIDQFVAQGACMDLTGILAEDPEWASLFPEAVIRQNSRNGKVYAIPNEGQLIGYYYNKELFAKAGIEKPADTWDEFFEDCAKLKAAGITPLSLQTGDNAFVSQLLISAMIIDCAKGEKTFLESPDKTSDYNVQYFYDALNMFKRLYDEGYTTEDSIGGMYENAANNFISGNTAMICNGTWMINSFSDPSMGGSKEFADKVGIALYPGKIYYANPFDGFMICPDPNNETEVKAAVAMLKHWTSAETMLSNLRIMGMTPSGNIEIPQDVLDSNRLLGEMLKLKNTEGAKGVYSLSNRMYPNVGVSAFAQYLTLFVTGSCKAEDVAQAMTECAKANMG